jgi:arsenite methyltransferase
MSALQRLRIDPSFIEASQKYSETQEQTKQTFAFKWAKRDTYESETVKAVSKQWLLERYCNNDPKWLDAWLEGDRKIILDVGCGSGYSALLLFGEYLKKHDYLGVDISNAVQVAKERFQEMGYPGDFLQLDLFELPIPDESIDMIFSEGVLHHTDNTQEAITHLSKKLKKEGRFLFYVYAKKGVIREFTDDYIRQYLQGMSNEDAWKALKPLTKLGIAMGEMNVQIEIPEDIPFLGISKGKIDLQRFFYWNICKLFYRPDFSLEEMNHANFDWFRPLNCHRHTKEEIISYCKHACLNIEHLNVQESGITVVAKKQ